MNTTKTTQWKVLNRRLIGARIGHLKATREYKSACGRWIVYKEYYPGNSRAYERAGYSWNLVDTKRHEKHGGLLTLSEAKRTAEYIAQE